MTGEKSLANISPSSCATVCAISPECKIRRRLFDLGLTEGTKVECVGKSPLGDPLAFLIRGAVIAIRKDDCKFVLIK